ncbi:hypothetical protein QN391_16115 [Pseudomonas sp. CCI1.2]|uniref:hypothetical protein n=1 Tax=unclassified Pseudomonas TaxID=196821 RepID=UPI002AC8B52C|nr:MULTISPECIES: hypothetical protein [unclassified Pseudomonas]MEB0092531.1 hypothetical protein [Pseudomonas sp. CCI4.2]MEB0122211.1 hypothetical protein [Pseudomonas sp. CCI1.2]WPX55162.1 hypothetical protein RHM65_06225 [Pseudomonas sp. CCI4.2]
MPGIGWRVFWFKFDQGYWTSDWIGKVSYLVIVFPALSYFFALFGEGNNKTAIAGASVVLWSLHLRSSMACAQRPAALLILAPQQAARTIRSCEIADETYLTYPMHKTKQEIWKNGKY